jgi:hypothetical protein
VPVTDAGITSATSVVKAFAGKIAANARLRPFDTRDR